MKHSILKIVLMLLSIFFYTQSYAFMYHYPATKLTAKQKQVLCKQDETHPFSELVISWNAKRPINGSYHISARLRIGLKWSSSFQYASWGKDSQTGFIIEKDGEDIRVYQDAFEILNNKKATGFEIAITCVDDAKMDDVYALHIYTNEDINITLPCFPQFPSSIRLPVQGISQMTLPHSRFRDMCSPTSTTAVVRYLSQNSFIQPIDFALNVWDSGHDIFGNWVLNTAQASALLGPSWYIWVERLHGFEDIYFRLQKGTPVVVSVRSPLPGSAIEYKTGHLIAVIGYDKNTDKVICMDPAFSSDDTTIVEYARAEFIEAWKRRGLVAYIFEKNIK